MRIIWLAFAGLLAAMFLILPRLNHPPPARPISAPSEPVAAVLTTRARAVALVRHPARADSVVAFGLAQRGTPYVYAGTSPLTGFDCSGFIMYTFAHFGVAVPHSTALLIDVGRPVARAEAQPGDIVVFTGTAPTSTSPGHAGIVVSGPGERPLRFVHASSARRESGVKVSQVEGTDYERRFMQVRRVLGSGMLAIARPNLPTGVRPPAPVAALPARSVGVAPAGAPMAVPRVLAPINPKKMPTTRQRARPPVPKRDAANKTGRPRMKRNPTGKAVRTRPRLGIR
ncbi:MAG: hypothetical protein NVS3B25_02850 [Hymenobacter sp.]